MDGDGCADDLLLVIDLAAFTVLGGDVADSRHLGCVVFVGSSWSCSMKSPTAAAGLLQVAASQSGSNRTC